MLARLLPPSLDNAHRGHKLALWLFGLFIAVQLIISMNTIFNGRTVVSSADGVPVDRYPAAAGATIVSFFALLGLARLTVTLLCILALVRYRAMIPLLCTPLLLQHGARLLILRVLPIDRGPAPPGSFITLALAGLLVAVLALSLWHAPRSSAAAARG